MSNEELAATLQGLLADSQQGSTPYITPRSYTATLEAYFGTTDFDQAWLGQFPLTGQKSYMTTPSSRVATGALGMNGEELFAETPIGPPTVGGPPEPSAGGMDKPYIVNPENGAMLYSDGTIVDPEAGVAVIRPGGTGSMLWLRTKVPHWDPKKVEEWRKTLYNQGYDVDRKGGVADDLINALFSYHQNRYLNGGEIVAFMTQDQIKQSAEKTRRDAFSKSDARNAVRNMFQRQFGDDPSDPELEEWTDWFLTEGTRMARRDRSGEQLFGRVSSKATDKFLSDPDVQDISQDKEEDEYAGQAFEQIFQAFSGL